MFLREIEICKKEYPLSLDKFLKEHGETIKNEFGNQYFTDRIFINYFKFLKPTLKNPVCLERDLVLTGTNIT